MGIEGWSWAIGLVWIGQIGVALRQLETRLCRSLSALKKNMLFSFLLLSNQQLR